MNAIAWFHPLMSWDFLSSEDVGIKGGLCVSIENIWFVLEHLQTYLNKSKVGL